MKTPTQIANELSISPRTVQKWCNSGIIKAYKVGNNYRITDEDYETFLNNSKIKGDNKNE